MKDWYQLEPDQVMLMNKHYNQGRGGKKIEFVVIHHNGGINSVKGVWDIWQYRQASAHYQVESNGWIGQLVWDRDTAWHAANLDINQRSIGIEVSNSGGAAAGWPVTDKAVEETAHLIAAICRYYKLGRPQSGTNVRYHREFAGTACPAQLAPGGKYHNTMITRAQYWYDQMTGAAKEKEVAFTEEDRRMLREVHRELTQRYPSRSAYRAGEEPVDTLAGMLLNIDARVHEDWIHARASELDTDPKTYANKLHGGNR